MTQHLDSNEIFGTTFYTYDKILELGGKNGPDAFALYVKYMEQSRIQQTNQTKTLNIFLKKGLGRGDERLKKARKVLKDLGLIDDIELRDNLGKITGHYVRVNFLINESKVRTSYITYSLSTNGVSHDVDKPTSGQTDTNALSTKYINAGSTENKICLPEQETTDNIKERKEKVAPKEKKERKVIDYPDEFEKLWGMYPHYEHRSIKEKTYDRWILLSDIEKERLYGAACELNILVEGGIQDNKFVAGLQVYINRNRNDEKDVDLVNLINIIRKQSDETKRIAGLNRARDIFGKNVINPIIINSSKSESGIKLNLY